MILKIGKALEFSPKSMDFSWEHLQETLALPKKHGKSWKKLMLAVFLSFARTSTWLPNLVNCYIAIENHHFESGFPPEKMSATTRGYLIFFDMFCGYWAHFFAAKPSKMGADFFIAASASGDVARCCTWMVAIGAARRKLRPRLQGLISAWISAWVFAALENGFYGLKMIEILRQNV